MSDWYAVARAVWDHELFEREAYSSREAWLWLVGQAVWKPTHVHGVLIQRGQCTFSLRFLAEKWGWSTSKVRRFLATLKNHKMIDTPTGTPTGTPIDTPTGTPTTVVTICNYEKFQSKTSVAETPTDTPPDTQTGTPTGTKKKNLTSKQKNSPPTREGGLFGPKVFSTKKTELPDGPPAKPKGLHLCPPEWEPTPEHHALGDELGLTPREVHDSASGMRDWSVGGGNKKLDWHATFRNWMRRDAAARRRQGGGLRPQQRKPVSWADIANAAREK